MKALSSSRLRLLEERCPHALDLAEDGAPYDASLFAVGKVAHAVLDALHAACVQTRDILPAATASEIAHATAAQMATRGSVFDGAPEAPVSVSAVREGVDLALAQFACEGNAIDPDARAELGLGASPAWTPEPYPSATHWRAVVDLVGLREDEDGAMYLWVRDYKSAWTTGPDAPNTLQMRGQILLALVHAPRLFPGASVDRIGREVVNLRTGAVWSEVLDLADDTTDRLLAAWRAEIDAVVRAIPHRPRPARPGPACAGCPYRLTCTAAPPEAVDVPSTARRYAALRAEADALEPLLRAATDDAPIEVDGHTLGWGEKRTAVPAAGAHGRLALLFHPDPPPSLVGLLAHLIGVSGIRSAVAALHPEKKADADKRDTLLNDLIAYKVGSAWTFRRAIDPERKEKP